MFCSPLLLCSKDGNFLPTWSLRIWLGFMAVCTGECRGRKVLTFLFDFSLTFLVRLCKKNGDRVQIMMAAPPKPASTDKRERQGCTSVSYQYKTNAHHQFGLLGIKTRGKMLMEGAELFTHITYIVDLQEPTWQGCIADTRCAHFTIESKLHNNKMFGSYF